jgi:hypothetical protein
MAARRNIAMDSSADRRHESLVGFHAEQPRSDAPVAANLKSAHFWHSKWLDN